VAARSGSGDWQVIAPLWLTGFVADVPIDISSDDARAAARQELRDPAYHAAEPSQLERALSWLGDRLSELLDSVFSSLPGSPFGLIVLALLAVVIVVVVRLWVGKIAVFRRGAKAPVFDGRRRSAAEHRAAADQAFASGKYGEAVRERFRGIVRDLEERGVLNEQSGRTVDEVAAEAGRQLTGSAAGLRRAARTFDDIVYGGRTATAEDYQYLVMTDVEVRAERPVPA
jgi:hypothetical protein